MSCCEGNCGCGSGCKCGSGCGGCKMYPEMAEEVTTTTTQAEIMDVAPSKGHTDGFEAEAAAAAAAAAGAEEGGCKCNPCKCNPCNC